MKTEMPAPLTLEEAEKWLLRIEDIATIERDLGFATRFVLGALLTKLNRDGILDSRRFILELRDSLPRIEATNERMAMQVLLDELFRMLPLPGPSGPEGHGAH